MYHVMSGLDIWKRTIFPEWPAKNVWGVSRDVHGRSIAVTRGKSELVGHHVDLGAKSNFEHHMLNLARIHAKIIPGILSLFTLAHVTRWNASSIVVLDRSKPTRDGGVGTGTSPTRSFARMVPTPGRATFFSLPVFTSTSTAFSPLPCRSSTVGLHDGKTPRTRRYHPHTRPRYSCP